jgi:hypothetical protein
MGPPRGFLLITLARAGSMSAKNARTFSARGENTIACIPVITP